MEARSDHRGHTYALDFSVHRGRTPEVGIALGQGPRGRPGSSRQRLGVRWLDSAFPSDKAQRPAAGGNQSGVKPPHSKIGSADRWKHDQTTGDHRGHTYAVDFSVHRRRTPEVGMAPRQGARGHRKSSRQRPGVRWLDSAFPSDKAQNPAAGGSQSGVEPPHSKIGSADRWTIGVTPTHWTFRPTRGVPLK